MDFSDFLALNGQNIDWATVHMHQFQSIQNQFEQFSYHLNAGNNRSPFLSLHLFLSIRRLKWEHWHSTAKDVQNVMCHEIIRNVVKLKLKQYLNFYVSHLRPYFNWKPIWTLYELTFHLYNPTLCMFAYTFNCDKIRNKSNVNEPLSIVSGTRSIVKGKDSLTYGHTSYLVQCISFRFVFSFPNVNIPFSILQFAHLQALSKWLGFWHRKKSNSFISGKILISRLSFFKKASTVVLWRNCCCCYFFETFKFN